MPNRDKVLITQAAMSILGFTLMVGIAARALRSASASASGRPDAIITSDGPSQQFKASFGSQAEGLPIARASGFGSGENPVRSARGGGRSIAGSRSPNATWNGDSDFSRARLFGKSGGDSILTGMIVKRGSELMLRDGSGKYFHLDMPDRARQFEGVNVRVTGTLESTDSVRVAELVPSDWGH
jgi:hypothetical protein